MKSVSVEDLKPGDVVVDDKGMCPRIVRNAPRKIYVEDDIFIHVDYREPDRRRSTHSRRGLGEGLWTTSYEPGEKVFVQDADGQ